MFVPDESAEQAGERGSGESARAGAAAERIGTEMAAACGSLNAASARVVALIAEALVTGAWQVAGIRSVEHWVTWQCGVSTGRAHKLVIMARRLDELPVTAGAFEAGELAEDQAAVICRHVPVHNDAEAATLARYATVPQLQHALGRYRWAETEDPEDPDEAEVPARAPAPEKRTVGFGYGEDGTWRLTAFLPPDEGALFETALGAARQSLFGEGATAEERDKVTWADAFVAVADRSLHPDATARHHRDRYSALIHIDADEADHPTRLHGGPLVDDTMRRYLLCDARFRAVLTKNGIPVSVGRAHRTAPEQTRRVVEHRDHTCRVPSCHATRWLHIHHVIHWEDGGATDTANLIALCSYHHRAHHRGRLGIEGDNADDPTGITFTDERGRVITASAGPAPPGDPPPAAPYRHPTGEPLDTGCVIFREPPARPAPPPEPPEAGPPEPEPDTGDPPAAA